MITLTMIAFINIDKVYINRDNINHDTNINIYIKFTLTMITITERLH
jgi:hypothetical protein